MSRLTPCKSSVAAPHTKTLRPWSANVDVPPGFTKSFLTWNSATRYEFPCRTCAVTGKNFRPRLALFDLRECLSGRDPDVPFGIRVHHASESVDRLLASEIAERRHRGQ